MSERTGKGWQGYIGGESPVQGCGIVDGFPWYFRARFDAWSMEIAEDQEIDCECLPVVGSVSGWLVEEHWGRGAEASYMDEEIAWELVEETIRKFRLNELPYILGEDLT